VAKKPLVAAVDVGTSKVLAAAATLEDAGLRVLGPAGVTSGGVRRGAVVDIGLASASLRAATQRLRHLAGELPSAFLLGSAGGQPVCLNAYAEVDVAADGGDIGAADVQGAMERVRQAELPAGYQLVHAIPQGYAVDGYEGCTDPVGMAGHRLAVRAHLVACQAPVLQNLVKAADVAGVRLEEFAVSALGAAEAVLTPEERQEGAVVLDLGAGATQVVVVVGGEPTLTAAVPLGGEHVTQDIAAGLRLTRHQAEGLKLRHASADPGPIPAERRVPVEAQVPGAGAPGAEVEVSERELAEIVCARVEETLQAVAGLVAQVGRGVRLGGGAVLTGGGSRLRGLPAVAMRVLGMQVRRGGALGATGSLAAPECAAVVGLVQMGAQRLTGRSDRLLPAPARRRLWPPWRALPLRQATAR
jgi:cell division protein FtsA